MKLLNKFFKTITKPKFIITLIILTFIATLIGVLVPQVGDKSPSYFETWKLSSPKTFYIVNILQLNRVYTSVWFLSLVFIIMLSLGYSIYLMIKRNLKRKQFIPPTESGWDLIDTGYAVEHESLIRFMGKKGYKLVHGSWFMVHGKDVHSNEQSTMNDERILVFSKNSINKWGGVIFHSGLFLIIIAALIGLAFQKRGFVQVMEGEVFSGIYDDFLVKEFGVFQKRFNVEFKTQLSRFRHEYWETGQVKEVASSVTLIDDKGNTYEDTVSPNHPVKYKGINIYQSFDYGYAISFILKNSDGRETVTHFLLDHPDKRTKPFAGSSDFPQTPYIFKMKFYPDISMNSFHLGKPILHLQVFRQVHSSPSIVHGNDERIFDGLIIPGNVINIEGNFVRFFNISQWSGLIYVKSPDMSPAYAGFFISCIGAAIIFLLPHKEIFISKKGSVLSLYGRTNRYKPLFDEELEEIEKELWNIK